MSAANGIPKTAAQYGKVSIIVPVFNVASYLPICMKSLLGQAYSNIEIILVDDGSTDECGKLCDDFCEADPRVRTFHKANGGLSSARNVGMNQATGEWILFVDSDDAVSPLYVSRLLHAATESGSEMATCRFRIFDGQLNGLEEPCHSRWMQVNGVTAAAEILSDGRASTSAWGKLASASLWRKHPFPEGRRFEDLPVTWKLAMSCTSVILLQDDLYFYRKRSGSISAVDAASPSSVSDYMSSIAQMLDEAMSISERELKRPACFRAALECCRLWEMCLSTSEISDDIFKKAQDYAKNTVHACLLEALCNRKAPIQQRLRIALFSLNPNLAANARRYLAGVKKRI